MNTAANMPLPDYVPRNEFDEFRKQIEKPWELDGQEFAETRS